jgi:hypothetical protein
MDVLFAHGLYGLGGDPDKSSSAGRQSVQLSSRRPVGVVLERMALRTVAMVPDQVHGTGCRVEMSTRRAILDAIAQGFHQRLDFIPHVFQFGAMAKNVQDAIAFSLCVWR